ncbi:uncharacterized protein TRIADDRAFT_58893 [Trichoplax adhaerens]|uniref:EF-hand domain-containing protein n=1 Tax=Trichoplax adhaerens TaxID=10228 RepID=B3S3Y9_TRIAD|nr:hypothetical protein TRIADDRAFT_58893 [Trichoplax adhaerens]EDV22554.1 hypothetical protein TRIADDRAFT_58893 [Trichoplax adhaerens]|eukprot:XP_002115098.1 hypothetical protein TRIADDRAFT_58893 [Trichoplax adhaerens]
MNDDDYDKNAKKDATGKLGDIYALMNALLTSSNSGYIKKSRKRWTDIRVSKNYLEYQINLFNQYKNKFIDKVAKRSTPVTVVKRQELMDRFSITPGSPSQRQRGLAWAKDNIGSKRLKNDVEFNEIRKKPGQMNRLEFKRTLIELLGTQKFNRQLDEIFSKVDVTCDGLVDWEDFCTYTLLQYQELDYEKHNRETPFIGKPKFFSDPRMNKEVIIRILYISNSNRYATVSKDGTIGVWGVDLELVQCLQLSPTSNEEAKKKLNLWVTDAVYMKNINKLAISTTSRDLYFLDTTTTTLMKQFHLFDLPSVPLCLDYWFDPLVFDTRSLLIYGDDIGNVTFLYFNKPHVALFDDPAKIRRDRTYQIFAKDLDHQSEFVQMQVLTDMHKDWVRRIKYLPTHSSIISCSSNGKDSLVVRDIDKKKKPYTFRVTKGIDCFDVSLLWNIIATGSSDAVRLWNPYVTNKPVAVMKGHQLAVIDVVIYEDQGLVLSFAKEESIRIWCIKEHYCLHSINLKFPLDARLPDHFSHVFLLQASPLNTLLITCSDVIAEMKMQSSHQIGTRHRNVVTHSRPLRSALYNKRLNQVVVGCTNSLVSVWDFEGGQRIIQFSTAHDQEELAYMRFDADEKRLLNASRNGSITVWNFTNGHCLHRLEPATSDEITGVVDAPEHNCFISVGWSKKIVVYEKDLTSFHLDPQMEWKGGQLHKEDILSIDYCPPHYVATGSFDGEIVIWLADTESVFRRLRKPSKSSRRSSKSNSGYTDSRHGPGRHAVENLAFLKSRIHIRNPDCGHLISSQYNKIYFWNILSSDSRGLASFRATQERGDTILSIHVDSYDEILAVSDSGGNVSIWDITSFCLPDILSEDEPPLLIRWKAHDLAVVSIQYIRHTANDFLLTASVDQTARVWTAGGHYVGTFGQAIKWDLKDPSTYQHPKTPWTASDSQLLSSSRSSMNLKDASIYSLDKYTNNANDTINKNNDEEVEELIQHIPKIDSARSVLGDQYSKQYQRRMESRRRRRQDMGEIDINRTVRFGKTCSPFQVIKTPDMEEFFLPRNVPMTPNMRQKEASRSLFGFAQDSVSLPNLQASLNRSPISPQLSPRNFEF